MAMISPYLNPFGLKGNKCSVCAHYSTKCQREHDNEFGMERIRCAWNSVLPEFAVVAHVARKLGRRREVTLIPDDPTLAMKDGRSLVLYQGDEWLLNF